MSISFSVIDAESLIGLGITLAEGVAKVVTAIQQSKTMTDAEKAAAIIRIKGQLQDKDAQVQATKL